MVSCISSRARHMKSRLLYFRIGFVFALYGISFLLSYSLVSTCTQIRIPGFRVAHLMGKGNDGNSNTNAIAQHQLIRVRGRKDSGEKLTYESLGLGIQCENVVMPIGHAMMAKMRTVLDQHSSVLDTLVSGLQWR